MKANIRNLFANRRRQVGMAAFAALTPFLLCGSTAPTGCTDQSKPSDTGVIVGAVAIVAGVAIGTVVLVEVHKSHHTVKGCVSSGPNGLEVRSDGDQKVYALVGDAAGIRTGDVVRLHGTKEKKAKGSAGDPTFVVEKVSKDFGPCKAAPAPVTP